jgi:hypothetical protein
VQLPPSTFALRQATLRQTFLDGNVTRYPESHFLDFVIGGDSLVERMEGFGNLVTPLNRPWLDTVPDAIAELRGSRPSPDLGNGRIALLVCGHCGDLGCGALTASLHLSVDAVTWADFRWEDGLRDPWAATDAPEAVAFRRSEYEAALREAYERLAALPYDELAHRGRRFLWP